MKRMQMATKNFNLAKLARNINIEDDGSIAFTSQVSAGGETIGSLTASMDSDQTSTITLSKASTPVPIVQAYKEISQTGVSSKGQWDVNANATNYDFYDEKPISYASTTLTPSATGDGTFTSSTAISSTYDISSLSLNNTFDISTVSVTANGGFFKPDGTVLYFHDNQADTILQYPLTTAWDLSTVGSTTGNVAVGSQDTNIRGPAFSADGTKMYTGGYMNDKYFQYTLSTAWDVTSASYSNKSVSFASVDAGSSIMHWKSDGSSFFSVGSVNDTVYRWDLTTAWDISTASNVSNFTISSVFNIPYGVSLNPDGTKMYIVGRTVNSDYELRQYSLSTAFDITTASYDSVLWDYVSDGGQTGALEHLFFGSSGARLYLTKSGANITEWVSESTTAFSSADVGKKVVGNSGSAIITSTAGAYKSVTPFADTSAISSWQLFGAQGKADGSGIAFTQVGTPGGIPTTFSSLSGPHTVSGSSEHGFHWSKDGTYYYLINQGSATIYRFICTTPWDISTYSAQQTTGAGGSGSKYGITVSEDGKHIYHGTYNEQIVHIPLSTAHDLSTAGSHTIYTVTGTYSGGSNPSINPSNANPWDMWINSNGTKIWSLINGVGTRDTIIQFSMSTAYDISTASYENHFTMSPDGNDRVKLTNDGGRLYVTDNNAMRYWNLSPAYTLPANGTSPTNITLPAGSGTGKFFDQYYFHTASAQVNRYTLDTNIENLSTTPAYNQYFPSLTNSSTGQINSSSWLDINSMTADETKNGGDIFYAVSTDNRSSWSVAKGSDGVRKIVKNNSGTWQYNNDGGVAVGYDIANGSYANVYFSPTSQTIDPRGIAFNSDGTKLYVASAAIWQYSLSSPYDISNPTYENKTFSFSSQDAAPSGIQFNNDGTKLYMSGASNHKVFQYSLSTAYDISTASYESKSLNSSANLYGFTFNNNGTKIYLARTNATITEHSLSTAYDVSTAGSGTVFNLQSGTYAAGIAFNSDGTKLFVVDTDTGYGIYQYNLSTAYDISTASYASLSLSTLSENTNPRQIVFNNNGSKLFVAAANDWTIDQYTTTAVDYSTSETWVNGTTNNEHATLQQALGAQSFNRMNKAQLDAVADGYHFSQDSADTLDLMIAPYAASGTSPISDGVTINYDAESIYRQAVPETDYRVDFQGTSTVEFTSNISANFKVKVV